MPGLEVDQEKPVVTSGATGAMEIIVSRAELLRELTATQSVVERKTTIPILSNFLFEAADDHLTITATDLDQSIRTSCAAKVKKPGACTIPARKLYDYIKLLGDGDISIKLHGQPLGADPLRPVQHQDGGHGAGQFPAGAGVSRGRRLPRSPRPRCEHDRARPSSPSRTKSPATRSTARC